MDRFLHNIENDSLEVLEENPGTKQQGSDKEMREKTCLQNITQVSSVFPKEGGGNVHYGAPPPWLGSIAQKEGGGNLHSGAPPPWLEAIEGDRLELIAILNSFVSFSNKSGKSKLNPKRVGAAWAERERWRWRWRWRWRKKARLLCK
ncbi:hypothetical protein QYF36_003269 [Acer negundo]|nr:hypothetical protein QYF36_003269 [Acer negundo]